MNPLTLSPFDTAASSNSNTPPSAVNANAGGNVDTSASANNQLGQNSFLQLLVTQLKNQDPSQPVNDSQWLSELANFSSLQQMQDINSTLTGQSGLTQISSLSSLIGQNVTTSATDSNGNPISGVVSGAGISNGTVSLTIGSNTVPLTDVTGISSASSSSSSTSQ